MSFSGDAYDSPPLWIRLIAAAACVFGAAFLLFTFVSGGQFVSTVLVLGGLILAVYLVFIVPQAGQTALVAALYWGMLGAMALFIPYGG